MTRIDLYTDLYDYQRKPTLLIGCNYQGKLISIIDVFNVGRLTSRQQDSIAEYFSNRNV